jgi:hypothetical protein
MHFTPIITFCNRKKNSWWDMKWWERIKEMLPRGRRC